MTCMSGLNFMPGYGLGHPGSGCHVAVRWLSEEAPRPVGGRGASHDATVAGSPAGVKSQVGALRQPSMEARCASSWASAASCVSLVVVTYRCVTAMVECPSIACTVVSGTPAATRCVAAV